MYSRQPPHAPDPHPVGRSQTRLEDSDRIDLGELFAKIWRRKSLIGVCVLIGALTFGFAVSQVTPKYTAMAKVMLDPRKSTIITDQAVTSDLDVTEQVVNTEVSVLRSNVLLEAVVARVGFDTLTPLDQVKPSLIATLKGAVASAVGLSPATISPQQQDILRAQKTERLVWAIRRAQDVYREGESFVIAIKVETVDPVLSMEIAKAISETYISLQLTGRQDAAQAATDWISDRVGELRSEVERAEDAVESYRAKSLILDGSSLETSQQQLVELTNRLALVRTDRVTAEAEYRQILGVMERGGTEALFTVVTSPLLEALSEQRVALLRQDAVWAERYDKSHPSRKRLATEIAGIEEELTREVTKIVETRRNDVEAARIREGAMEASLNEMESRVIEISANASGLRDLERKLSASRQAYEDLLARHTETRSQEQLQKADSKIVERATIPGAPSAPRPKLMIAIGGMTGFAAGLAFVFFLELSTAAFRSEAELERETGLPVLASVPLGNWKTPRAALRELELAPQGIFAERIRHLRTSLFMRTDKGRSKSILITSSVPTEGKTTTTLALAKMAALGGKKVIVVDCDFRRPSMQRLFKWDMDYELADFIANECSLGQAIHSDKRLGFDVLTSSEAQPLAVDDLSESWLKPMLETLKKFYDVVLVDAPPVLAVSDALILSAAVDTRVYMVRWDSTPRNAVQKGLSQFAEVDLDLAGVVMTMVDPKAAPPSYTEEYAYHA